MEDQKPHLHVSNSPLSRAVAAVAAFANFEGATENAAEGPVLLVSGKKLEGLEAARFIAKQHKETESLLGVNGAAQKEVQDWLDWADKELGDTSAGLDKKKHLGKLAKLNQSLTDKVFLVANRLSLADIVLAAAVAPLIPGLDERSQLTLFALVRWFDFLQHYPKIGHSISTQTIEFDLNAPFKPLPAKPAAEGKEKEKEKGGEKADSKPAPAKGEKAKPAPKEQAKKEGAPQKGKEAAPKEAGAAKPQPAKGKGKQPAPKKEEKADITRLDIRVGVIRSVARHPSADKLYVEQIDLGEGEPRQVVSGLVEFVPESEMLNARVICLCNLKPAKMRDVMSHAMVLCGSNKEHTAVELIKAPEDAKLGERIIIAGFEGEPDERLNPKRNPWSVVQPDLFINDDLVASYKDKKTGNVIPFQTSAGPCKVKSLVGASIA